MKFILSILVSLFASISAFGQNPTSVYWLKSRVTDSTTVSYPTGWGVFYYNAQSAKWRICNGAGVCKDVGTGGGGISSVAWGDITGVISDQTDLQDSLSDKRALKTKRREFTSSHTIQAADAERIIFMNSASSNNYTVAPNSSVAIPLYTTIWISQTGAGVTTVVEGGGVTVTPSSGSLIAPAQNALMMLYKTGTDTWLLFNGTAILPIDLTTDVAGVLPIANGGTGLSSYSGKALNYTRVNAGETAMEFRTPTQVRSDISAQPLSTPLTQISALTLSNDDFLQQKAGALTNRTIAQVRTDLRETITTRNRLPSSTKTSSFTLAKSDTSKLIVLDGSAALTITLADFSSGPSMQFIFVRDSTQVDTVYFNAGGQAVQFSGGKGVPPEGFAYISYSQTLNKFFISTGSFSSGSGGGGGSVNSVSGTTNRVTSTGGTDPIIDISSTFEALLGKVANRIDQNNASTTSAQLASIIGDETGTNKLVYSDSPVLVTPNIGSATGSISGNAGTATALATGRTISITGDLAYTSPAFDGTGNVTAAGTLATVNSNVGTFGSATQSGTFTVNAKGLITAASNVTIIPSMASVTGTLPIANGGTNNTTFDTNGITYYDGSKIASNVNAMTWDDTGKRFLVSNLSSTTLTAPQTGTLFHLVSNSASFNGRVSLDSYVASQTNGSIFQGRTAQGTNAAPTAAQTDQVLAAFGGDGYGTTGFHGASVGSITIRAGSAHTDANAETYLALNTTSNASSSSTERFRIGSAGQLGIGGATFGTSGNILISGGASSPPSWLSTGTNVNTFLTTPSWTNFNSMITGTAPFWSLASGGTTTATNTITSPFPNAITLTGTWTGTASAQAHLTITGTLTGRASNADDVIGLKINSSITAGANTQRLFGAWIQPTFSTGAFSSVAPVSLGVASSSNSFSIVKFFRSDGTTSVFDFRGSGDLVIGSSASAPIISSATNAGGVSNGQGIIIQGTMLSTNTDALTVTNATTTNGTSDKVNIRSSNTSYTVSTGTGSYSSFTANPTINVTGGTQKIYGYRYAPIETAVPAGSNNMSFVSESTTALGGVNVTAPNSFWHVNGSFATAYVAKTGAYTLTVSDCVVEVTSGTHTQTLPTAVGIPGRQYIITNSGSGVVTVGTTSSQTFVNVTATPTTLTLAQFQTATVISNGANWLKVSGL